MKKLRGLLYGVIATIVITPLTLAGCSKTTKVEENVRVNDDTPAITTTRDHDVKVNVHVDGNNPPPQPVVIEKKEIVDRTTNVTTVEPKTEPEKKIEVHNNVTTVNPPQGTTNTDPGITTTTTTTTTDTP
jgi:hypothetical protein